MLFMNLYVFKCISLCVYLKKNVCVAFHLHFLYPIYFPKCIYFCLPFTHFCIIMQMRGAVSQLSSWRLVFAIITGPRFVRCQDIICVVNLKIVLQFTVWDGRGALTTISHFETGWDWDKRLLVTKLAGSAEGYSLCYSAPLHAPHAN